MKKKIKNSRSAADFLRENFAELSAQKEFEPQLMKFTTANFTVKETIVWAEKLNGQEFAAVTTEGTLLRLHRRDRTEWFPYYGERLDEYTTILFWRQQPYLEVLEISDAQQALKILKQEFHITQNVSLLSSYQYDMFLKRKTLQYFWVSRQNIHNYAAIGIFSGETSVIKNDFDIQTIFKTGDKIANDYILGEDACGILFLQRDR